MELCRQKIASIVVPDEDYHVIDIIPLEAYKYSRSSRTKIYQENTETSSKVGYFAAQKSHCFGYKVHAVFTVQGVIKTFDISNASVHDINYLHDVKYQQDCFETPNIKIETPIRKNKANFKPFFKALSRARNRIITNK